MTETLFPIPVTVMTDYDGYFTLRSLFGVTNVNLPLLKKCRECGVMFAYGKGTKKRITALFCSPSCRGKHYYKLHR